jgi:hypothetical protein
MRSNDRVSSERCTPLPVTTSTLGAAAPPTEEAEGALMGDGSKRAGEA